MSKKTREERMRARQRALGPGPVVKSRPPHVVFVDSLYDAMEDGAEYTSILDKSLPPGKELLAELTKAINGIERVRGRPCLAYVGNLSSSDADAAVTSSDDLPFREMVAKVPAETRAVDVFLATNGGSAHQVSNFVNCLRERFEEIDFLIPSFCMSAGTLFALSGDHIWMTDRACLGPIDPQVPTASGRFVPAQALLLLVQELQRQGDDALRRSQPVPWTAVRIIDSIDKKELGEAVTASQYSLTMASQFLQKYKFRTWSVRETSRTPVTEADKIARANEIAAALVSHDRWKSHGHAIPRDVLWREVQLRIDHPDAALQRVIVRCWALFSWLFDKTPILKVIISTNHRFVRHTITQIIAPTP